MDARSMIRAVNEVLRDMTFAPDGEMPGLAGPAGCVEGGTAIDSGPAGGDQRTRADG